MKFECNSAVNKNKVIAFEGPDFDDEFEVTISTPYEDQFGYIPKETFYQMCEKALEERDKEK